MTMLKALTAILATAVLASCASQIVKSGIAKVGGPGTTTVSKPAKDAPYLWVILPARGTKFKMSELATQDGVTVYAAGDGSQMALREGVLINTRGFGRDLMSSQSPSLATLTKPGAHSRIYFDLDGTDTMRRHDFSCTTEVGAPDETGYPYHFVENCLADIGTIRNEYWLDSGRRLQASVQWVSQGVGYAAVGGKEK